MSQEEIIEQLQTENAQLKNAFLNISYDAHPANTKRCASWKPLPCCLETACQCGIDEKVRRII